MTRDVGAGCWDILQRAEWCHFIQHSLESFFFFRKQRDKTVSIGYFILNTLLLQIAAFILF